MAKKAAKCNCPKPGPTAPFFMLTYGDMMTLLMCFFVLLFAMSTVEVTKFQAQVSIMQGSLGISKFYRHSPMQQNLPSPAVKQSIRVKTKADAAPKPSKTTDKSASPVVFEGQRGEDDDGHLRSIHALGVQGNLNITKHKNEVILVLPSYGIFGKGAHTIDASSPEVHQVKKLYEKLAKEISVLTSYDIEFVGHTDTLPLMRPVGAEGPRDNTELGFKRGVAMYEFFFAKHLRDRTRITFASQGDNIPIIPNATLDSDHRKNRRVEIHLKKKFM